MTMRKRDESNKEKTPSSYNQTTKPIISSSATVSSLLTPDTSPPNSQKPSIQHTNIETIQDTSHLPPKDPRSIDQGLKNDTQAAADLLGLSSIPRTEDEGALRQAGYRREPPSPPSAPEAPAKKQRVGPPGSSSKKSQRAASTSVEQSPIQFVPYLGPPQPPKRRVAGDVIWEESMPSPAAPTTSTSPSPRSNPTWQQSPLPLTLQTHGYPPVLSQTATIAPGPFVPTVVPHHYSIPTPSPPQVLPFPPSPNFIVPQPIFTSPWPAAVNYSMPSLYGNTVPSLEQLLKQRLRYISYSSSTEHQSLLLKRCLPEQPLNFFITDVTSQSQAPIVTTPENTLQPFRADTSEASTTENLPPITSVVQTLDVPAETQRAQTTQAETSRGPPKKLPLHFLQ